MKREPKETEIICRSKDCTGNTMALNSYLSIVTLNMNGLHAPVKRYRVSRLDLKKKKQDHP